MDCSAPWILCPWDFSRQEYWSGLPCPPAGVFPTQGSNPGIEPRSPTLRANSLPTEMPGKPKNTRLGSLSLLQGILPTQESNRGLLHCRWILYQLSYQGSPTSLQGSTIVITILKTGKAKKRWLGFKCRQAGSRAHALL